MTNYPQITEITKLDEWVFEPKNITKHSTNVFLDDYSEVDGLKTGFTNYAGYCQIISASLCDLPIDNSVFETIFNKAPVSTYTNNRNIFASVLGSTSKTYRTRTLASILDYSKSSLAIYPVADKLVPLYTDDSGVFSIIPAENISLLLPNNSQIDYQVFINPLWQYTNMLVNGMNVGKITYYSDDMTPVTTELILDTHQSNTDLEEHVEALQIADEELRYSRYSGQ